MPVAVYTDPQKTNSANHNLDFLRACSVLFVLADHTLNSLGVHTIWKSDMNWLGRTGVLFFFVHTCCVLMMSLDRHKGEGLFSAFYIRRAFRIYPLSIAAVLVAMMMPHAQTLSQMGWFSNLALIQNLTFSPNAFGSLWSLPLEVQMYLFLPFIFLLAQRSKTLWPLILLFIASIPVALWQPHHIARASVLAYVPAFIPGVIAYWLFRKNAHRLPSWGVPLAITCITAAMLAHPGWTFPAWTACLALGLSLPLFRGLSNGAINKATSHLAKYSYGIYLSHGLLLTWMQPTWRSLPLYLAVVAVASVASYHTIEYPMIWLGRRVTPSGRGAPHSPSLANNASCDAQAT
jgi:peptidoglycan/LPS O-acetylase OafA/YrhL